MKRVLHVVSSMNRGGIEIFLLNYFGRVDRNKVSFDFLLSTDQHCELDEEIESLGGRIYRVTMKNPLKYLFKLNSFFKSHAKEYDVCHLHHVPWGGLSLLVAKWYGVKNRICHVHYAKKPKSFFARRMLDLTKLFSTHFFACGSSAGNNLFGEKIVHGDKFNVIPNAIDVNRFKFNNSVRENIRRSLGISEDCLLLGQVARLSPIKNHKFSLELLAKVKEKHDNVKFLIVGDGEIKKELKQYAQDLGVAGDCIFVGSVSNVEDYLHAMDIMLFPSINEGLGIVAIEAQTSGLKILASTGVPQEAKITDLVTFIPLSDGVDTWASVLIQNNDYKRCSKVEEVKNAGFDISENSKRLQDFYLQLG